MPAGRSRFGNGHSIMTVGPDMVADPPHPDVLAYEAQIVPEMRQRLGPRLDLGKPIAGTVFPNFSMLRPTSRTIRVWHPRGPDKTECWAWVFVDKAAPPEVKKALRLAGARVFGPGGTFEQDDMDNWQGCTQTGRGAGRAALSAELRDGARPRALRRRPRRGRQRLPLQRKQPPRLLPPLGAADGRRRAGPKSASMQVPAKAGIHGRPVSGWMDPGLRGMTMDHGGGLMAPDRSTGRHRARADQPPHLHRAGDLRAGAAADFRPLLAVSVP